MAKISLDENQIPYLDFRDFGCTFCEDCANACPNDVLLLEGGVVHTPNINMHFKMGLKHKTDIFSCLAEVVLLTYIGESRQSVGEVVEVDFNILSKFDKYSQELGLRRGDFQNFNKIYSKEDIEIVKNSRE